MRRVKMAVALSAAALGAVLPWRARVLMSELLGWAAHVVPPSWHRVEDEGSRDA